MAAIHHGLRTGNRVADGAGHSIGIFQSVGVHLHDRPEPDSRYRPADKGGELPPCNWDIAWHDYSVALSHMDITGYLKTPLALKIFVTENTLPPGFQRFTEKPHKDKYQ